jgi:hypothetical protein
MLEVRLVVSNGSELDSLRLLLKHFDPLIGRCATGLEAAFSR